MGSGGSNETSPGVAQHGSTVDTAATLGTVDVYIKRATAEVSNPLAVAAAVANEIFRSFVDQAR